MINLSYQHGTYVHRVVPVRVGVYYFEDNRPGWSPTGALRMFDGTHGKGAGMRHAEGTKDVNVFVAESLRAELAAAGMAVSASKQFDRVNEQAISTSGGAATVDRVVMGRINYFGVVGPVPRSKGASIAAGVAVGGVLGGMVSAKLSEQIDLGAARAYVDVDLWVVDPGTGKILWAGTAHGKFSTKPLSDGVADYVAVFLPDALFSSLKDVIPRSDFLAAMGATLLPTKALRSGSPMVTQEQDGQRLFKGERFTEAAVAFQAAYRESGDPAQIFNAALCYRRTGEASLAHAAFTEYLRKAPKAPPRATVEERVRNKRQQQQRADSYQ